MLKRHSIVDRDDIGDAMAKIEQREQLVLFAIQLQSRDTALVAGKTEIN